MEKIITAISAIDVESTGGPSPSVMVLKVEHHLSVVVETKHDMLGLTSQN